ncbi:unnamed protein product [Camellia sinensis]
MKEQEAIVAATMDNRSDGPIRISDLGSNTRQTESPNANGLWACVKLKYKVHDIHKTHVMQKFAKLWHNYKSELSRKVRTLAAAGKGHLARNIALTKPDKIGMDEWKAFVKNRLSKSFIEKKEDMKNQSQDPDSISRVDVWIKGHTRQKGKPINEVHKEAVQHAVIMLNKRNGDGNKVQELHKPSTEEGSMFIKDDAIVQAFGPERRGSVGGLGFGALPSKVDAAYQNQNVRQLNEKLLLLEQELREIKAEMLKGKRPNEERSKGANGHSHGETQGEENGKDEHRVHGGGECRMHSQQNIWGDENNEDDEDIWLHDANETGNGGSLDNDKCKLLNWDGTKVVVAEGTIASTDSKALVHHVPLGPGCWKVWVNHVIVNAPLFRPNREMFVLEDAIGSTVAWPTHFISFDFETKFGNINMDPVVVLTGTANERRVGHHFGSVEIDRSESAYIFRVALPGARRNG